MSDGSVASTPPAHAGVHFPPPFIYGLGLVAAWLLNRWHALPLTTRHATVRDFAGDAFALVWLSIFASAFLAFRRAHTTLIPNKPASAIVSEGPYRWTRNPMYVSLVFLYLGGALWLNTWWAVVLLPIVVLVIDRMVIAREERYLSAAFPDEYPAYVARVRRWI